MHKKDSLLSRIVKLNGVELTNALFPKISINLVFFELGAIIVSNDWWSQYTSVNELNKILLLVSLNFPSMIVRDGPRLIIYSIASKISRHRKRNSTGTLIVLMRLIPDQVPM